jgi:hypothetical protein
MKKITVSVIPTPVSGPAPARRETELQKFRRELRSFFKPSYAGYNEA